MPTSKSTDSNLKILVTTGDTDGIGWEVTAKALNALGPQPGIQFFVYKSLSLNHKPDISKKFKKITISSPREALALPSSHKHLVEIASPNTPAAWVEEAAGLCHQGYFSGLVTAPLSKPSILQAGMKDIGHTEILARVTKQKHLFMGFVGKKFSVVLATGHRPLRDAIAQLNIDQLALAYSAAKHLRQLLPRERSKRPIALVGLNPHAGENGIIGVEEDLFRSWIKSSQLERDLHGPLVPDSAFLAKNWPLYSVYICAYHDQGLIPFKLVHGFSSGVHLTLGLPFVRTSVDHGTAKELFGKNKADFGSMKDAMVSAIRLCKARKK